MKYKLLKDTLHEKAGLEFTYNPDGDAFTKESESVLNLINAVGIENKEYFEPIPKKPKSVYDLKYGDKYYYISSWASILDSGFHDYTTDYSRRGMGNMFLTKEEAQKKIDKNKARETIRRWKELNDDWEFEFREDNWFSYLFEGTISFIHSPTDYYYDTFYFSTKENAIKCYEECEKAWYILSN